MYFIYSQIYVFIWLPLQYNVIVQIYAVHCTRQLHTSVIDTRLDTFARSNHVYTTDHVHKSRECRLRLLIFKCYENAYVGILTNILCCRFMYLCMDFSDFPPSFLFPLFLFFFFLSHVCFLRFSMWFVVVARRLCGFLFDW